MPRLTILVLACLFGTGNPAHAQRLDIPQWQPISIQQLQAVETARYPAIEAGQGAAADAEHFYAIVNTAIGKYSKASGELAARWVSARAAGRFDI